LGLSEQFAKLHNPSIEIALQFCDFLLAAAAILSARRCAGTHGL
jgi:hypothetical protein